MDFLALLVGRLLWEYTPTCGFCHKYLQFDAFKLSGNSDFGRNQLVLDICCKCKHYGRVELSYPSLKISVVRGKFNFLKERQQERTTEICAEDAIAEWQLMPGLPVD